ncbi:MAG: outer membrane lipid asymmetry maintenance protein MlaD [Fluviicoccus sp.]|uniref:outer membrane lipid asymmetry maintenance protein MlaD n=1 Tax=Fluviicoccus sp. TaxID=2003552 RepID=UPI002720E767|nr:outer membrane lipid asymmetry maintenance protein MlaD [Fluviicoccus sp.]MDO8329967.1 outer membrane lipid asymmetry maintenance protein MlaD [Fluviicoccus sp.]
MRTRSLELAVGTFLVAAVLALFFLAIKVSGLGDETSKPSYRVYAHFQNIGGLTLRAKVTMAGVTIGRVTNIELDHKRLNAKVTLDIHKDVNEISTDVVASILTAGLLGEKYIGLVPGADDTYLKEGDEIEQTQSSLVLEDLIGKFLFNKATEQKPAEAATTGKDEFQ